MTDDEIEKIGRDPFLVAYAVGHVSERCIVTTEHSNAYRRGGPLRSSQERGDRGRRPRRDGRPRAPSDHPLLQFDNVLVTPHVAFSSQEVLLELEERAAGEVASVLQGRMPDNLFNTDVLSHSRMKLS